MEAEKINDIIDSKKQEEKIRAEINEKYGWDGLTCLRIILDGQLEYLKYLCKIGDCNFNSWLVIDNGHLECIKYAHEHGCPWNEQSCQNAARKGYLEYLKYLHESGCPWNEDVCHEAATFGHLECLKYLHENGCPWDRKTCAGAAGRGQLECLKYAHENGCPWDELTYIYAISGLEKYLGEYAHKNNCSLLVASENAEKSKYLECFKYLYENGCPKEEQMESDATPRYLYYSACLRYLHKNEY
jgi:hypothetical protein